MTARLLRDPSATPSAHPLIIEPTDNWSTHTNTHNNKLLQARPPVPSCSRTSRVSSLLMISSERESIPVRDVGKCKGQCLYLARRFLMFFEWQIKTNQSISLVWKFLKTQYYYSASHEKICHRLTSMTLSALMGTCVETNFCSLWSLKFWVDSSNLLGPWHWLVLISTP